MSILALGAPLVASTGYAGSERKRLVLSGNFFRHMSGVSWYIAFLLKDISARSRHSKCGAIRRLPECMIAVRKNTQFSKAIVQKGPIMISIITATKNCDSVLPRLIESLRAQTCQDFEWIIADGGSTDETVKLIDHAREDLRSVILASNEDFGIYDALNKAIKSASGDFYVVVGSDDYFLPNAVEIYTRAAESSDADFITAPYQRGAALARMRKPRIEAVFSQFVHVTGHAVGLAIRRSLHSSFGYYSAALPIAADQYFILKAIHGGAAVEVLTEKVGFFSEGGISNKDAFGVATEIFRVNVLVGHGFFFQLFLLVLRLVKAHFRSGSRA